MPRAAEAALVAVRDGLVERERRQAGRVDALGEVEVALAALAPRDGDLAAQGEGLEHLGDVAVVGPAGRGPGHDARVGDVAREQGALGLEPGEDVAAERVVGGQPVGHERVGLGVAHLGDDGRHVLRGCGRRRRSRRGCGRARGRGSGRPGRRSLPSRLHSTRSALGAMAAVGSICRSVSRSTTATRSVGRGRSSSCAWIAMRRAWSTLSRWTMPETLAERCDRAAGPRPPNRGWMVAAAGPIRRQHAIRGWMVAASARSGDEVHPWLDGCGLAAWAPLR